MVDYKVKIVLATYNGENYISTQLESILNQTYSNWEILVSDDGSNDKTVSIIKNYSSKDKRIRIVNENLVRQGACQNFGNLLKTALDDATWEFLMFADQDDFWNEDKIQLTLNAMLDEKDFSIKPKLVYTDFLYASDKLVPLHEETDKNISHWMEPNLGGMLVQNNIYGCTVMINRLLAKKACPIPICSENHDYWIGLVAVALGNIIHLKQPTMLYRQHSNNVSGHYTNNSFTKRFKRFFLSWDKLENSLFSSYKQANALSNRFGKEMTVSNRMLLDQYCHLIKNRSLKVLSFCYKNKIRRNTFVQNIMLTFLFLKILMLPNKKLG